MRFRNNKTSSSLRADVISCEKAKALSYPFCKVACPLSVRETKVLRLSFLPHYFFLYPSASNLFKCKEMVAGRTCIILAKSFCKTG